MSIGITALAFSISSASKSSKSPIPLSHAQQFIAALIGFKSLASYQAAVKAGTAPENLARVRNLVVDKELLAKRHQELKCGLSLGHLKLLISNAIEEKLPDVYQYDDLDDYIELLFLNLQTHVEEHPSVVSEIGLANHAGVKEVYFDYDLRTIKEAIKELNEIKVEGSVSLIPDIERPYSGHRVNFEISLDIKIYGNRFFGDTVFHVTKAKLNQDWSDDTDSQSNDGEIDAVPNRTMAEIYAELTGLTLEEAELISDVEAQESTGSSGEVIYGYFIDFSEIVFPDIKVKILRNRGRLDFSEGPNFLDGLSPFD
jgi:hypothetical protein